MTTSRDLLRAICLRPDDLQVRLVYADWCEEHDRPVRAEFIRTQIEYARSIATPWRHEECNDHSPCPRYRLQSRQVELMGPRLDWWDDYGGKDVTVLEWRCGFAEQIVTNCVFWLAHGPAVVLAQPVRHVRLADREPQMTISAPHTYYWTPGESPARHVIPAPIFSALAGGRARDEYGPLANHFATPESAHAALSAAALSHARREAGLDVPCRACEGKGRVCAGGTPYDSGWGDCPDCKGAGWVAAG